MGGRGIGVAGIIAAGVVVLGVPFRGQIAVSGDAARQLVGGSERLDVPAGLTEARASTVAPTQGPRRLRRWLNRSQGPPEITLALPGGVQLVMVKIPAGTFTMGSRDGERGRYSNEGPQHQVTIAQDHYVGETEVTQEQWQAVMGTAMPTSCGSHGTGAEYPVYCVSWDDICGGTTGSSCVASSFVGTLNRQQGTTKFRLPTEAEWERAARALTATEFSFTAAVSWDTACGSFPEALAYMWWCGNAGPTMHPVAQKLANPWGLFDMHGNVWEWVQDWWHDSYTGAPTDGSAWESSAGAGRVIRGGGWDGSAPDCRSAGRCYSYPGLRGHNLGFRLARSP